MDSKLLQRVMALVEKTGDRMIVVNPESGQAHAILPFDAYEELVSGKASLKDLDFDEDEINESDKEIADFDDLMSGIMVPDEPKKVVVASQKQVINEPPTVNSVENSLESVIDKMADESQKEAGGISSLDVLDDEADEEQYYLEPIE